VTGSDRSVVDYAAVGNRSAELHAKEPVVKNHTRFVGLDVHAEKIAVAIAEDGRDGELRYLGSIPNDAESVAKLVKKLGRPQTLRACYEAGPTGYGLYWQLSALGVACDVVAPTLIPVRAGDRVKTDRRDAEKLARCHRSGELTAVWVPDATHEALRDLVRAREAAKKDQTRARNRLSKFLLRRGHRPPTKMTAWTRRYLAWLEQLHFEQGADEATWLDLLGEVEHASQRIARLEQAIDEAVSAAPAAQRAVIEALQCLRGVAKITAATIVAELGQLSRFDHPSQLMGYTGVVPREHSSGEGERRGAITKTGNAHLRRVLGESSWAYRRRPGIGAKLRRRQVGQSPAVLDMAWKAQLRLCKRYRHLVERGKPAPKAVTAVSRELLGFIWAIGVHVERQLAA
jgi:transposase